MVEQLVLWASTEERGGITEYLRVMQQTPLWATWDVQHVVTHREGSKLAKFGVFASSVVFFAVNLVRLRPALVHVHAANDASFVRKAVLVWLSSMARVPAILHIHGSGFEDYSRNRRGWSGRRSGPPCEGPRRWSRWVSGARRTFVPLPRRRALR